MVLFVNLVWQPELKKSIGNSMIVWVFILLGVNTIVIGTVSAKQILRNKRLTYLKGIQTEMMRRRNIALEVLDVAWNLNVMFFKEYNPKRFEAQKAVLKTELIKIDQIMRKNITNILVEDQKKKEKTCCYKLNPQKSIRDEYVDALQKICVEETEIFKQQDENINQKKIKSNELVDETDIKDDSVTINNIKLDVQSEKTVELISAGDIAIKDEDLTKSQSKENEVEKRLPTIDEQDELKEEIKEVEAEAGDKLRDAIFKTNDLMKKYRASQLQRLQAPKLILKTEEQSNLDMIEQELTLFGIEDAKIEDPAAESPSKLIQQSDDIEQQIEVEEGFKVVPEAAIGQTKTKVRHDKAIFQAFKLIQLVFMLRCDDDKKIGSKLPWKGKDPLKEYKERVSSIMNKCQI